MTLSQTARRAAAASVAAVLIAASAGSALAAKPAAPTGAAAAGLQAMRDFDLIVLGNMTAQGDVEGRALIGGDLSGSGIFFKTPKGQTTATLPGLIVGGDLKSGENLNNGSGAWVGGSITASGVNLNGGGTVLYNGTTVAQNSPASYIDKDGSALAGLPMPISDPTHPANQFTYINSLKALSSFLATDATSQAGPTSLDSGNNLNITAMAGASGLGVMNISGSLLASGNQLNIDSGGYSVLVVNVSGTSDTLGLNPGTFSANEQTTVIFNFYEATSLSLQRQFNGSILAPRAAVTNNTQINGTLVAGSFIQGGEIHMNNFAGVIPGAPEPAAWALMILGFGAVGAMLRRRRSVAAAA